MSDAPPGGNKWREWAKAKQAKQQSAKGKADPVTAGPASFANPPAIMPQASPAVKDNTRSTALLKANIAAVKAAAAREEDDMDVLVLA